MANPHTTADASYTCTHKGMCNKLWDVMWHDHGNFEEYFQGLHPFQRYSHLPGLSFFARKVREGEGVLALFAFFILCVSNHCKTPVVGCLVGFRRRVYGALRSS